MILGVIHFLGPLRYSLSLFARKRKWSCWGLTKCNYTFKNRFPILQMVQFEWAGVIWSLVWFTYLVLWGDSLSVHASKGKCSCWGLTRWNSIFKKIGSAYCKWSNLNSPGSFMGSWVRIRLWSFRQCSPKSGVLDCTHEASGIKARQIQT